MVVQNPFDMGVQTVRLLKAMIQDDQATIKEMLPNQGQPDGDIYTTGLRVVVPEAESPVKADAVRSQSRRIHAAARFQGLAREVRPAQLMNVSSLAAGAAARRCR